MRHKRGEQITPKYSRITFIADNLDLKVTVTYKVQDGIGEKNLDLKGRL